MNSDYLVRMANDIAAFYAAASGPEEAAQSIFSHVKRFWDPRMRAQILAHYASGGEGLVPVVRQAVALLRDDQAAAAKNPK
jgi:formate dehydrogenase subunit delta